MSQDPITYGNPLHVPQVEQVVVELAPGPDGQPALSVRGYALQMSAPGQEWERICQLLVAGLRAAAVQAAGVVQTEPSRIVPATGVWH